MSKSEFTFSKPILSKSVIYGSLPLKPIRRKVTVKILGIFTTLFNFIGYVSSNVKKSFRVRPSARPVFSEWTVCLEKVHLKVITLLKIGLEVLQR